MSINWSEFNPLSSLLGGGILGLGAIISYYSEAELLALAELLERSCNLKTPQKTTIYGEFFFY